MSPTLTLPSGADKPEGRAAAHPPRLRSADLLQGQRRIVIEHGNASYTLLLTRNDKLILTK